MQHRLSYIRIENFRSCRGVDLPLDSYTPLVGQNNSGKSTILEAIRLLIKPSALTAQDYSDPTKPVVISGLIEGLNEKILERVPEKKHRAAFAPCCPGGVLWIRVSVQPGKPKDFKQEIWDHEKTELGKFPTEWRDYTTGIPQAVSAIFPDPLVIRAMKDVAKDFTSMTAGTSIKSLIEAIAEPITAEHKAEIESSLNAINKLLAGEEGHRSQALVDFDKKASDVVADFFPGLGLRLELPETKLKEFFKSGSLKIKEEGRDAWTEFEQLGSGAQRSIEMGLIRYLAEEPAAVENPPCKLLLIDEPELYLHPQGVRRIRRALKLLSQKGFQVIFSTHNPIMLDRENTAQTIIVKKPTGEGTQTRIPLRNAVEDAIKDAPSQTRVLFQLGNLAEIYFADTVVICEGKTDNRLLPLAYERHYGRAPEHDHIAFVSLGSCSDIPKGMAVLKAMGIKSCAVADLDFAFTEATKGDAAIVDKNGADMNEMKRVLGVLQPAHQFTLNGGMPCKGNNFVAADIWAIFAADADGQKVCTKIHNDLQAHSCWIWTAGCIEHVMGIADKGEDAIIEQEAVLRVMPQADVVNTFPTLVDCFEWIRKLSWLRPVEKHWKSSSGSGTNTQR